MNLSNPKLRFLFATIITLASFLTIFFTTQQAEAANPYIQNVSFGQDEQGDYISFDWVGVPERTDTGAGTWWSCQRDLVEIWFNRFNPDGTTERMRFPSYWSEGDFIPRNAYYSGGGYSGFGNYGFASGLPLYDCATNDPNLSTELPKHIKTYINPNWSPEKLSFTGEDFITIQIIGLRINAQYAELLVHDPEEYHYQVPTNPLPVMPYTNVSFGFNENDLLKVSFDWVGPSRNILPLVGFNGKISYPFYARFDSNPEKDVSMNWEDGRNQNLFNVNWFTGGFTAQKGQHYDLFAQELHKWTPSNGLRVCNWFYPCPVNRTLTESFLGRNFEPNDYITIAFYSSGYVLNDPNKYYFSPQNNPPTLSFPISGPYAKDGIDPNIGDTNTQFTFRVVYTDADGDKPVYVNVHIEPNDNVNIRTENVYATGFPDSLDYTVGQELLEGKFAGDFPAGTYKYYFETFDGKSTVRLPETGGFQLLVDSPAQFAAEPSVRMALPQAKVGAKAISEFYHNNEGSFSIYTGGKYATCLFLVEPDAVVLCLAGVFAYSRIDEFLIFAVDSLANDPPRQDFDIVAKIKPTKPLKPFDDSPFGKASAKYETATARQVQIRDAILVTFERLQGAIIADEGEYMLLQSKTLVEFFERLEDNQENLRASTELLIRKLNSSWNEELGQRVLQLAMSGFSTGDRQLLEQAGLTEEEIATLQITLSKIPTTGNLNTILRSVLQEKIQLIDEEQTSTRGILMTLNEVVHNLQAIICSEGNDRNELCTN